MKPLGVLTLIRQWWEEAPNSPLHSGALIGPGDDTIQEMVKLAETKGQIFQSRVFKLIRFVETAHNPKELPPEVRRVIKALLNDFES